MALKIEVHELDYGAARAVVCDENGVTIRSWLAIKAGVGLLSLALEWKGLKDVIVVTRSRTGGSEQRDTGPRLIQLCLDES